jgi:molecular chaperone HtpG
LRLVIHSMYSHKEIFLRELISNASDACEKLRFEALAKPDLLGSDSLSVTLLPDAAAGTLSIKDNGVGMSEAEVIDNLGTIARSGTKKFLETLSGDSAKDAQLIGQFGVGFYSAFIVADKVTVLTKRSDAAAVRWDSDGEGQYQIQPDGKSDRGTEVILHLRDEDKEFLEPARLRQLVRKYSDHLSIPIILKAGETEETVNQAKAFWTRPKSELSDEDYQAFYKHISHDSEGARVWAHNKVEGNIEYTSLLYLPKRAPFDLFEREQKGGIQLYVKRVFIMDKAAELLPPWLRFMRGLVDTADLPLNVSRELLQNNRTVRAGQALAGPARGSGGEQAGRICGILEILRRGAEGRHHRGSVPEGTHRQAAALPFHGLERRCARGDARSVRVADEVRPEGHLLSDRRYAGGGAQ